MTKLRIVGYATHGIIELDVPPRQGKHIDVEIDGKIERARFEVEAVMLEPPDTLAIWVKRL